NREGAKSQLLDDPGKSSDQSLSTRKFSQAVLGGDFPGGGGGDEHFVGKGSQNRLCPLGKPAVSRYRPQQRVGIHQNAHQCPQASSSSSGRGCEKSAGTVNLPLKRSKRRNFGAASMGTILATTFLPRAISTSSPCSACSINFERVVLA